MDVWVCPKITGGVLEVIRSVLKKLLHQRSLTSVRYFVWARDARRDARAAKQFAQHSGVKLVNIWESPILHTPVEKVLFILGSGSSVNDMSAAQFAHIGENRSIGINYWYFHDFVPNVFSFDAGRVDEEDHEDIERTLAILGRLFDRKPIVDSQPQILYLRPLDSESKYLVPVPGELADNRWVSARANLISQDPLNLESDLRLILKKIANRSIPTAVLPDNGSSVVRMIFLGLAQGYKDIVLTGVDLDDRPHFWFSQKYVGRYKEYVALFPTPKNRPHGTTQATNRPIGNIEFLALLGRIIEEEGLGRLWLSSLDSRLSGFLTQYVWPCQTVPEIKAH